MYKISQNSYTVFFDFHHRFSARLVYDVRRSFSFDPRGKRVREKGEKIGGEGAEKDALLLSVSFHGTTFN